MNCEETRAILLDYLLEEVPAADRAAIRSHVKSCEGCAEELARLRQTRSLLLRAEAAEEIPQRIRLALEPPEPMSRWAMVWSNSARVAFAGAGLFCLAIGLLALSRASISYRDGNFELAFGSPARSVAAPQSAAGVQPAAISGTLSREEALALIAEAVAASEARRQAKDAALLKSVARQAEQRRGQDLKEISEGFRYLQAAQTMMWKDQVQNQHLVGTLLQRTGLQSAQP